MPPGSDPQECQGSQPEESRESQQRLQMHLDRRARAFTALSNIMQRLSDTQKNVIDKLK
ncbi:hypothetical protein AB0N62_29210 [Streptomyces sp. NPDC093982]|uniref:hypothetical protein n=1 Tax=Streptomyces sp. NPDC093982 TaxID=3155077 RepID=UPI0034213ED0